MALTLRLAWRSFIRHRRRSAITVGAIAFGLAMMLAFVGIADDGHARMADMGIRLGSGHVVVQGKGYQDEQTLVHHIANPAPILASARAMPHVEYAVPRISAGGLIKAAERSRAVLVSGVDPTLEPLANDLASDGARVAGNYLRPRSEMEFTNGPADIYVGTDLAESLGVATGDRVVLTVSPVGDSRPASAAFVVRGIFKSGVTELDGGAVQIPLQEAQALLGLGEGVTQVGLLLSDERYTDTTTAGLVATISTSESVSGDDIEVLPWKVALRELYEALALDDMSLYLMMAIIFIIVGIGIFNTVLMSVAERTREFGVMMAVGTSRGRVFSIIFAEAFVLAVVSACLGLAIGLGIHALVAHYGIDVGAMAGGEDYEFAGIAFSGRIYSTLSPWIVTKWTLVVMGIVMLSAAYPALRATRLEPVEAMRHA
jgi:ABC-type lipoprotein release transport system permease subunit